MVKLDRLDVRILEGLQADASTSVAELAQTVGLSQNACWRRIKLLEEAGVVERRVALLSAQMLGLELTVFVSVRTNQHNVAWLEQFARGVRAIPEVVEFYRMTGEVDYLLKLHVRTMADYDRVYHALIAAAPLSDVSSSFAMETIKRTTALPLPSPATT